MAAGAAHPAADFEAVHPGHQDVEDQDVRRRGLPVQTGERLAAVGLELDLVALELERAPERLTHRPLVVHDHDLHGGHCAV